MADDVRKAGVSHKHLYKLMLCGLLARNTERG